MIEPLAWVGIFFCASQAALFSGLNLAYFSLSRMQLQVKSEAGDEAASRVLRLREDSNFLLTTVLWGNVAINVLLTLLSNSVLAGISAFLFSTIIITFIGEILPQAYFSRNALRMASMLSPIIRVYQFLLYPVAKPTALALDAWLGKEGINYLGESDLKAVIQAHIGAQEAEVEQVEGIGAINFLAIDDLTVGDEGEIIDELSIISLPSKIDFPLIPKITRTPDDSFLQKLNASGQSWAILTNEANEPLLAIDADACLRDAVFEKEKPFDPYNYCHRPIVVNDSTQTLGDLIYQLKIKEKDDILHDGVLEHDVILLWGERGEQRRIITGSDLLGRLLKGITSENSDTNNKSPS